MTAHRCKRFDPTCFRCDLGRDETEAIMREQRIEACGLLDAAEDIELGVSWPKDVKAAVIRYLRDRAEGLGGPA